jgi:hypothetical protein
MHVLGLPPRGDGRPASMVGNESLVMMGPGGMATAGPLGLSSPVGLEYMMERPPGTTGPVPVPPHGTCAGGGSFRPGLHGGAAGAVAVNDGRHRNAAHH